MGQNNENKLMVEIRQAIVDEARSYIGVRFIHRGRTRQGVDCVGLLYLVFNKHVGLPSDFHNYAQQPKTAFVYRTIRDYADRIKQEDAVSGDVVLMHFSGYSTHFGILSDKGIIHADRNAGCVSEQAVDILKGRGRIVAYYRIKGVK